MFKIEILDTETGEVTHYEADAVCAGLHLVGEPDTAGDSVGMFRGNVVKCCVAAMAARDAAAELFKKSPKAAALCDALEREQAASSAASRFSKLMRSMAAFIHTEDRAERGGKEGDNIEA